MSFDGVRFDTCEHSLRYLFRRLSHQIRQPDRVQPVTMFVLRRDKDGKCWAGPWRFTGKAFTIHKQYWWGTATRQAMQARVDDEGFRGVSVVEVAR